LFIINRITQLVKHSNRAVQLGTVVQYRNEKVTDH